MRTFKIVIEADVELDSLPIEELIDVLSYNGQIDVILVDNDGEDTVKATRLIEVTSA